MCKCKQPMVGISMIEMLVTLVILSIGLVGLARLQTTSIKESFDSAQRSHAAWHVQELVERMRANPEGQADGYALASADEALCANGPTKFCSDFFNGLAKVEAAADCTANEVAEFDVWELSCGFELADTTSSARSHLLLDGVGLTLGCEDADAGDAELCSEGSDFTATLNWVSTSAEVAGTTESSSKAISLVVRP
jgi:type IV pilus assembly protein PilV